MEIKVDGPVWCPESAPFETVERKSFGHPDTLCDAMAERASVYYSRYCLDAFGAIAHHWFDKVLLVGGESEIGYGRGALTRPFKVVYAGKAAHRVGDRQIPVISLLRQAAADVLVEALRSFDPDRNLVVESELVDYRGPGRPSARYRPQSVGDLLSLDDPARVSNDCSICVGFSPPTTLERLVLLVDETLTNKQFRFDNLDTGSDIKIIGIRSRSHFTLDVNLPFIAEHVPSWSSYLHRVDEVRDLLVRTCQLVSPDNDIEVGVNSEAAKGLPYLTVTGTVADTGDVGMVGRGNRANGLITPMRPMSIEAAAGKNPLDHGGKLYAVVASRLATRISEACGTDATVTIVTAKERPLNDPEFVFVGVGQRAVDSEGVQSTIELIVRDAIRGVNEVTTDLLNGLTLW